MQRKKRWNDGQLARPTQRESKEPAGEKKAVKTAARIMRENGMLDDGEAEAEANGFPD